MFHQFKEDSYMDILFHRQEIYRLRDELHYQRSTDAPYLPREMLYDPPQYFSPGPLSYDPDLMNEPALRRMRIEIPPRRHRVEPLVPVIPLAPIVPAPQNEPPPPAQETRDEMNLEENLDEVQEWSDSDSDDLTIDNPPKRRRL